VERAIEPEPIHTSNQRPWCRLCCHPTMLLFLLVLLPGGISRSPSLFLTLLLLLSISLAGVLLLSHKRDGWLWVVKTDC
jgi:hypothetical protein